MLTFSSTIIPSPISSSPSSDTGQMSSLGSFHTLGLLRLLLPLFPTRCLEPIRMSFRPLTGGDDVFIISGAFTGSGGGKSPSGMAELRWKHLISIFSIHLLSFAVGEEAAVAAVSIVKALRWAGESERDFRLGLMSAARWLLKKTSRSSAGDIK